MSFSIKLSGGTTQVKKVVVGTPVRKVTSGSFSVNNIAGINLAVGEKIEGSLLVFDSASGNFIPAQTLTNTNITGESC